MQISEDREPAQWSFLFLYLVFSGHHLVGPWGPCVGVVGNSLSWHVMLDKKLLTLSEWIYILYLAFATKNISWYELVPHIMRWLALLSLSGLHKWPCFLVFKRQALTRGGRSSASVRRLESRAKCQEWSAAALCPQSPMHCHGLGSNWCAWCAR